MAQEHTIGAKNEDIARGKCLAAIVVEEVSDTVQRNRGFAATRRSLYHKQLILGRANDPVLLLLNGGDNITQLAMAILQQLEEQRVSKFGARELSFKARMDV